MKPAHRIEGDPRIRKRFQIWVFLYDTGNPIAYSAGRLRAALTAAVQELDPEGTDPALRRMVVIGHSQGGLLTKFTAIDSGTKFWDRISKKPFAIDNMNPRNPGLRMLESIAVAPRIKAHSIIAVKGDGPKEAGDDGVVAYESAHIDGVASELVVRWDHSCQGQHEVIEEIRRILLEHAAVPGDRRP